MAPRSTLQRRGMAATAVLIAVVTAVALGTTSLAGASERSGTTDATGRAAHLSKRAFHDGMRQLWEQHVTWTRLFIVSFVADLPDLQVTTDRLLQNQVDIGDAVKPFYGKAAGDQLTALLTDHILTAADVLTAAKAGDTAALQEASDAWYANARQIAKFLHAANPKHWPLADLRMMMKDHLDLTLQEASNQLTGEYAASVDDFDEVEAQIIHMADMLSAGIIAQFPRKFS